jgi:hypothetical protein
MPGATFARLNSQGAIVLEHFRKCAWLLFAALLSSCGGGDASEGANHGPAWQPAVRAAAGAQSAAAWTILGASGGVPTWGLSETIPSDQELAVLISHLQSIGANSYEISTSWFMASRTSTQIVSNQDLSSVPDVSWWVVPTVSDQRLEQVIKALKASGIKVFLRPGIELYTGEWRGSVAPADWDAWFTSYRAFITHYARLAERTGVDLFSVGFELNSSVAQTEQWKRVISEVRAVYNGAVSYDCGGVLYHGTDADYMTSTFSPQWEAASEGAFLADVDLIGVDWYPSLGSVGTVDQLALNAGRISDQFLAPLATKYGKRIYFAEIDYSSVAQVYKDPLSIRDGVPDQAAQSTAYEAVFRVFSQRSWFAGMFPTSLFLQLGPDQAGTSTSIAYKQAEAVFSRWYGGSYSVVPCLLNWAETQYAQLFPGPGSELGFQAPFYYRYFPTANSYVGISTADGQAWAMGLFTGNIARAFGSFADFQAVSGCQPAGAGP